MAIAMAALVLLVGASWGIARNWRPSTADYPIQGVMIDESSGAVVWPSIGAAGADFAYLRATADADIRDARFAGNWRGAASAGLRRGAAHIWSLCRLASDQASNFIATVPREADALPPVLVLDYQPDCGARPARAVLLDELARFIAMVEAHATKPVILKIAEPFDADFAVSSAIPRTLWSTRRFFPPDYAARAWVMWEATDLRHIDGVSGPIRWTVVAP